MKRLACLALLSIGALALPAGANHQIGHTTVFARIGAPGMPEGLAVRNGAVYVSTHTSVRGNANEGPSKIFVLDMEGTKTGELTANGQALNATHGLLATAFDADGRLYVLDRNPARMLRFDVTTGQQEIYATIPSLAACRPEVQGPPCSPTTLDQATFPDYFAFDAAGNAYVTDLEAATIYRIPPGGGEATVWFQDARLDGVFGPNGIAIGPDGALIFAMTASQTPERLAQGVIYRLPLVETPTATDLQPLFTYPDPASGPDGIAFGASGKLYVALAGSNQVSVLDLTSGTETARFPETPVANNTQEIPYDLPASIAFDGSGNILVTNQSFLAANANNWAVLRAWVNDTALPLTEPELP